MSTFVISLEREKHATCIALFLRDHQALQLVPVYMAGRVGLLVLISAFSTTTNKMNRDNVAMEAGESGETLAGAVAHLTKLLDENQYEVVIGTFENVKAIDLAGEMLEVIDDATKPSSALVQLKAKLEEILQLLVAVVLTDPRVYGLPQSHGRYYITFASVPGVSISTALRTAFQDEIAESMELMHLPEGQHLTVENIKMPRSHPDFEHWYDAAAAETSIGRGHHYVWSREIIQHFMRLQKNNEYLPSDTHK